MNKQGDVYLMTHQSNTVIDAGVTRDRNELRRSKLRGIKPNEIKRIHPHRQRLLEGFTKR